MGGTGGYWGPGGTDGALEGGAGWERSREREQCSLDTRGDIMSGRNPSYRGSNVVYIRLKPSLVIAFLPTRCTLILYLGRTKPYQKPDKFEICEKTP